MVRKLGLHLEIMSSKTKNRAILAKDEYAMFEKKNYIVLKNH